MVTLKKTLAITLSTLVLLQPVSASAATWGKIVQNIRANEVYDDGATTARVDGNTVTIAGGAIDDEVGISSYRGDLKLDGIFNIIFKKVEMTCVRIDVGISGNYNIHMDEDTTVAEGIHASANGEGVDINLTLAGTVNGDIYADALKGASMNTTNEGTVQGVLYGSAQDGGCADIANTGAVSAMNTFAMGEGSEMTIDNSGSIGGKLEANANDGSSVNVVNSGSMDSALITANMNTAAELKDAAADFKNTEDGKALPLELIGAYRSDGVTVQEALLACDESDLNYRGLSLRTVMADGILSYYYVYIPEAVRNSTEKVPVVLAMSRKSARYTDYVYSSG